MRLLILGGTVFLGRALTDAAIARGHSVTHVHRGRSAPSDDRVETLPCDREEIAFLRGVDPARTWDSVVDTSGYLPQVVARSAEALRDRARMYAFISSISAYASFDPADRFTWWPWRIAQGGKFVAPRRPQRNIQFIDVRDVAEWTISMLEASTGGIFQVDGPERATTMGEFIEACRAVGGSGSDPEWVPTKRCSRTRCARGSRCRCGFRRAMRSIADSCPRRSSVRYATA